MKQENDTPSRLELNINDRRRFVTKAGAWGAPIVAGVSLPIHAQSSDNNGNPAGPPVTPPIPPHIQFACPNGGDGIPLPLAKLISYTAVEIPSGSSMISSINWTINGANVQLIQAATADKTTVLAEMNMAETDPDVEWFYNATADTFYAYFPSNYNSSSKYGSLAVSICQQIGGCSNSSSASSSTNILCSNLIPS